eukprot:1575165-Rhodomonas_salina.1
MAYGGICIRACYDKSGTDIAYGDICLRARYAVFGTVMVLSACVCATVLTQHMVRACYAMSGSEIAYGATRWTSSRSMVVPRYCALSAYARATRCPVLT